MTRVAPAIQSQPLLDLLETRNLGLGYADRLIVPDLNLRLAPGAITTIIGPNGCGKSTILRAIARLLKPKTGTVLLDGQSIHALPTREIAKRLAILPQGPTAPEGLSVEGLAQFGRYPHQTLFGTLRDHDRDHDREVIGRALEATNLSEYRDRPLETLSGGQRQRAWISMALAQDTPILLLDEPTTYLDISHQIEVLELLTRLNASQGKTVVMVLHDLNQAARYSHELIVVSGGRVVEHGTPEKVMTLEMLREVFGLEAHLIRDPASGKPHCIPYGLAQRVEAREIDAREIDAREVDAREVDAREVDAREVDARDIESEKAESREAEPRNQNRVQP